MYSTQQVGGTDTQDRNSKDRVTWTLNFMCTCAKPSLGYLLKQFLLLKTKPVAASNMLLSAFQNSSNLSQGCLPESKHSPWVPGQVLKEELYCCLQSSFQKTTTTTTKGIISCRNYQSQALPHGFKAPRKKYKPFQGKLGTYLTI